MYKSIEEQIACRCIHFNGIQNLKCDIGIKYKSVRIHKPFKFPCLSQGGYCSKAKFLTETEVIEKVKELKFFARDTILKIRGITLKGDNKLPILPFMKNDDDNWISVKDKTPELIKGENYSENVFALINNELFILCYCYIPGDDGGFVWANCNGKIDGDAEFDDEYEPTHWQPLPKPIK